MFWFTGAGGGSCSLLSSANSSPIPIRGISTADGSAPPSKTTWPVTRDPVASDNVTPVRSRSPTLKRHVGPERWQLGHRGRFHRTGPHCHHPAGANVDDRRDISRRHRRRPRNPHRFQAVLTRTDAEQPELTIRPGHGQRRFRAPASSPRRPAILGVSVTPMFAAGPSGPTTVPAIVSIGVNRTLMSTSDRSSPEPIRTASASARVPAAG